MITEILTSDYKFKVGREILKEGVHLVSGNNSQQILLKTLENVITLFKDTRAINQCSVLPSDHVCYSSPDNNCTFLTLAVIFSDPGTSGLCPGKLTSFSRILPI